MAKTQPARATGVVSAKLRLSSLVAFLASRALKGERIVVFPWMCNSVDYHHALFLLM
jgi:ATP-dependent RNA helicase DDX31/DBP7